MEQIIVTGTTIPSSISGFPSDITVIDRNTIESSHARNVADLLRTVTGVFVDQQGGRGGISSIYLRGADPNFTLILLDGVKLNDPNNSRGGSFDLSTLGTDNVERIEIVKGPQSAVYGSDALAGVVNIITFKGSVDNVKKIDSFLQTDKGFRLLTEARGINNSLNYSISASYADDGDPVPGNKFKSPTFISNIGYVSGNLDIQSVTRYSHIDSESFPDDSGGPEYAVIMETEERKFNQFITGLKFLYEAGPKWVNSLNLFLTHIDEDINSPGVAPGPRDPFGIPKNESDSSYTRFGTQYISFVNILDNQYLAFGLDTQYERGKSTGTIFAMENIPTNFNEHRFTASPLIEVKINLSEEIFIQSGARIDITQDYGTEFSPHIGILYKFIETGTNLSANWGEGFKLPSFFALGNPVVGNEDLRPETSSSFDIKIEKFLFKNVVSVSGTYFYNKFKNLIDFDEGPPPGLLNLSRVETQGIELEVRTKKIYNTVISGNLSHIKTDILNSEENLRNRPEWLANLTILWTPVKSFEIFTNINYVGSFLDSSIPTGERRIGDYLLVDGAATYFIRENLSFYIEVENILNQKYQQFVGFEAPGIRPGGGIQWYF